MIPAKSKMSAAKAWSNRGNSPAPKNSRRRCLNRDAFLTQISRGKITLDYSANRTVFAQGDPADSVWYIQKGKVKLVVTSPEGREAIVIVLGDEEFFGEGCLAGQPLRMTTSIALSDCTLHRIEKSVLVRLLQQQDISELFLSHLLKRATRFEEDLVDQLFNSSEKRLARILLLLTDIQGEGRAETVPLGINQEHLAQMVGTTRSRVSHFMNRFRTMGFIDYVGNHNLTVNSGLLAVAPHL
jgi:CRP/FNR family transcriptional regulator, cyclic AMP receptor protein